MEDMLRFEALIELVRSRRTVRGYHRDKEVPEGYIRAVLDTARWAPSGANSQPWEFVVIRDPAMRQRIVSLFLKQCRDKDEMELAVRGGRRGSATGFKNAPVFVLVLGDPRVNEAFPVSTYLEMGQQHFITGLASATLLIHLAAASLGLGSQWVSDSGSPYMSTILKAWLGIPQYLKVYDLLAIGYPVRQPSARPRRPLE